MKEIEQEQEQLEATGGVVGVPAFAPESALRNPKGKAKQTSNEIGAPGIINIPFVFDIYSVYRTVTVSFGDIIAQLDRAYNDLADLAGYVGNFVNWWNDMKIGLGCLQSSISFIKPDRFNPLRQEVVLKQWKKFREQNVQYQRRVCEIQCHYFQLS